MSDKTQARTSEPVKPPVKKAAAKPEAQPQEAPKDPVVARVGGYVNRDDGNGWILEEEK